MRSIPNCGMVRKIKILEHLTAQSQKEYRPRSTAKSMCQNFRLHVLLSLSLSYSEFTLTLTLTLTQVNLLPSEHLSLYFQMVLSTSDPPCGRNTRAAYYGF